MEVLEPQLQLYGKKMDNLNILIIEDESLVAMELKESITELGYKVVDFATNCAMAKEMMKSKEINLILMDINLGESMNGIELYKEFNTTIPIIYLTAYKDDVTIAQAIETNPVGYLIKPQNEDELKAVLKLALFKIKCSDDVIKEGHSLMDLGEGYLFDTEENRLFFNDLFIKLSHKEMLLLKLLVDNRGHIVSYESIKSEIWNEKIVTDSALRTLIYRLRGKLEYKLMESEYDYGIKLV